MDVAALVTTLAPPGALLGVIGYLVRNWVPASSVERLSAAWKATAETSETARREEREQMVQLIEAQRRSLAEGPTIDLSAIAAVVRRELADAAWSPTDGAGRHRTR